MVPGAVPGRSSPSSLALALAAVPPIDHSPHADVMRRIDAVADGMAATDAVATGFPSVDKLLGGGLRQGDLVVLGGDIASGKSALALAMAYRAAERPTRGADDLTAVTGSGTVAFLSGEMSPQRVTERLLAIEGRARVDELRRGVVDDRSRASIGAAAVRVRDAALGIEPLPGGGVAALADTLRSTLDLRLAVVDSLEHLVAGASSRDEELAAVIRRLKDLALELEVPILVTAQLNRLDRARHDLRPRLEDFAALGAVAEIADVVLGLFREEMYAKADNVQGATELLALKHRNGALGYVDLYFYAHWLRFEDMLDPDR